MTPIARGMPGWCAIFTESRHDDRCFVVIASSDREFASADRINHPRQNAEEESRNIMPFLLRREITTRNVREGFFYKTPIPRSRVLKLRICDYPNPLRQRGIELLRLTQCLEKSLAHASGYDNPLCFLAVDLPQP